MKEPLLRSILLVLFIAAAVSALAIDGSKATVYVYRPSRFKGAAVRPSIYLDGMECARLHNGKYVRFDVPPGHHLLTSATYVEGDPYVNFQAGEEYFFRLQAGSAAPFTGRAMKLLEVPQERAVVEMQKLKQQELTQQPKP